MLFYSVLEVNVLSDINAYNIRDPDKNLHMRPNYNN